MREREGEEGRERGREGERRRERRERGRGEREREKVISIPSIYSVTCASL